MSDNEVSVKKVKKSKKSKKEVVEEVVEEPVEQVEEEEEEPIVKKSKKSKKEPEPQEEENGASEEYQVDHEQVAGIIQQLSEIENNLVQAFKSSAQKAAKAHSNDATAALSAALALLAGNF